jgi:hypothetical protein
MSITPEQVHKALTTQDYTTIGILVVGFAIVLLGGWKLSSWIAKEIIVPGRDRFFIIADQVKDKFFGHLDRVGTTLDNISTNLGRLTEVPERLDRIEKKVDTLGHKVEVIDEHLNTSDSKFSSKTR